MTDLINSQNKKWSLPARVAFYGTGLAGLTALPFTTDRASTNQVGKVIKQTVADTTDGARLKLREFFAEEDPVAKHKHTIDRNRKGFEISFSQLQENYKKHYSSISELLRTKLPEDLTALKDEISEEESYEEFFRKSHDLKKGEATLGLLESTQAAQALLKEPLTKFNLKGRSLQTLIGFIETINSLNEEAISNLKIDIPKTMKKNEFNSDELELLETILAIINQKEDLPTIKSNLLQLVAVPAKEKYNEAADNSLTIISRASDSSNRAQKLQSIFSQLNRPEDRWENLQKSFEILAKK